MADRALTAIDWAAAWFAPFAALGRTVAGAPALPPTAAVRFVPADALPPGMPYESFVATTGCVPTRDNLHDFFNGLAWHAWPQSKQRMNALQAAEIAARGVGATRGPVRDALTVLDENGAVFSAPPVLADALRAKDWQALFTTHRAAWADARLWLVGHALAEQLAAPRKDLVAHCVCAPPGLHTVAAADAWLAAQLHAPWLASKPFAPLPVLGVPGWWPANADPAFYADASVFRPPRGVSSQSGR